MEDEQLKFGFIGFGEAAYCICLGLKETGFTGGVCAFDPMVDDPQMGPVIQTRAQAAGVTLLKTDETVIKGSEIVVACVPSGYTLAVCKSAAKHLAPGQLYADVSASTPATKRAVWAELQQTGALFVDAAMLGSLPQDKHKVPITASGNGAQAFYDAVTPLGMRVTLAGEQAGDASAIKLVRSIFMKGMAALMLETTQAAKQYGVEEAVAASLGKSMDGIPFEDHLTRMLVGTAIHASRRASEVKGSIALCEEANVPSLMSAATVAWHERVAACQLGPQYSKARPESWRDVISDITEKEH